MRTELHVKVALDKHSDLVKRISLAHLKNYADIEDVFQKVFMKYVLFEKEFENQEHEKAWFIRVTINECKDDLKSFFRTKVTSLDAMEGFAENLQAELPQEDSYILSAVCSLPEKYKDVIYLHYYEGYSAVEIAKLLNKNENTIYTWLSRAKGKLKKRLGGSDFEE